MRNLIYQLIVERIWTAWHFSLAFIKLLITSSSTEVLMKQIFLALVIHNAMAEFHFSNNPNGSNLTIYRHDDNHKNHHREEEEFSVGNNPHARRRSHIKMEYLYKMNKWGFTIGWGWLNRRKEQKQEFGFLLCLYLCLRLIVIDIGFFLKV